MTRINAYTRLSALAVASSFVAEAEFSSRLHKIAEVFNNTMNKFPAVATPSELSWAQNTGGATFTNFRFTDSAGATLTDVMSGKAPVEKGMFFSFYTIKSNWQTKQKSVTEATIPVELLFNDPMAAAHYARKLIRTKQELDFRKVVNELEYEINQLGKKIEIIEQQKIQAKNQKALLHNQLEGYYLRQKRTRIKKAQLAEKKENKKNTAVSETA